MPPATPISIANTTQAEAERAFQELQAPPLLARAAKRALLDQDHTLVVPSLLRRRSVVNAQAFVVGHEATSVVACWDGVVLAGLHCEVVNKADSTGPATVMRRTRMAGLLPKWASNCQREPAGAPMASKLTPMRPAGSGAGRTKSRAGTNDSPERRSLKTDYSLPLADH